MIGRRALIAQAALLAAVPAWARGTLPPPKVGAIRWPGPVADLHGYMAVPAHAHGRQSAVLVLPGTAGADQFARGVVDALALAGFVACIARTALSSNEALATLRWLATNRYATGKVAALAFGEGNDLLSRLVALPQTMLAAAVSFGGTRPPAGSFPTIVLDPLERLSADGGDGYDQAWREAIAFLEEHLA